MNPKLCLSADSLVSIHYRIALEPGKAGSGAWVSGAGWVTEGLMLALSFPVKSSSDTTRTIEARNCPLDFPFETRLKKSVSHVGAGQEKMRK